MYVSKSEKGWGKNTRITRTCRNGLLVEVKYHDTVVAAFTWAPHLRDADEVKLKNYAQPQPDAVTINTGGWNTLTTRARINQALHVANAHTRVITAANRLLLNVGGELREWDGRSFMFEPPPFVYCACGENNYRVAYASVDDYGRPERKNLFVFCKEKTDALIIARTKLPGDARIYGVYSPLS